MASAASPEDITDHWAKGQIEDWIGKGLVSGYPDGTFKPDNNISRSELMAMVNRTFGYSERTSLDYKDVTAGAWYADAVAKAAAAGYIGGYADGTVKPEAPISRQETAVVIMKIRHLSANETASEQFTDFGNIPAWSKGAIGAAVSAGIMGGYPDKTFRPGNPISRAEAVIALSKALGYVTPPAQTINSKIYDKAGTYGPATGTETIKGEVTIKAKDVTLQNIVIEGNLTIDEAVADGNATLKKVVVKGTTYIYGGGANSIYLVDTQTGKTYVMKDDGPVRIVASGSSEINELVAQSSIKVEEVDLSGKGFEGITVDKKADGKIEINLVNARVENFEVKSEGVTINTDRNTHIATLVANAGVAVTGTGTVESANINAGGVTFETRPATQIVASGVSAPTIMSSSTSSGGGGGGGGNSTVYVSGITVTGTDGATTIAAKNGTLQMSATVTPTSATTKTVTWSVIDVTGSATINTNGLLTAVKNGKVIVKATANDGSGKYGEKEIAISGQAGAIISTTSAIANGSVNPTVVITLENDSFTADEISTLPGSWTGSVGTTGLMGGTITRNSDRQVTFYMKGTAKAGTLSLQANAAALTGGAASNTITITVPAATQVTVSGVAVKTPPAKVAYNDGDPLDLTGLAVTLTKSNNSSEEVALADFAAKGITTSPLNGAALTTSDTLVTITVNGKTATQAITVSQVITPPAGDLLDANAGSNFTGVLYTQNGNIYYNQADSNGTWGNETLIGTGTEGRVAIDGTGNPHIAYTTAGKIGYRMYNGSNWTEEVLIESNNGGTCYKPDIAVDGDAKAYITYTDTLGNAGDYTDHPDIMYAANVSGIFTKCLITKGYYQNLYGSCYLGNYCSKGSFITMDANGNYYVLFPNQDYYKPDMQVPESTFSVKAKLNPVDNDNQDSIGGAEGSSSDIFDLYDLISCGNKVIALYKQSVFKTSELTVSGTAISFANTGELTGSSVTSVATDGTNVVVGGTNNSNLQIHYNGTSTIYDSIAVEGSKVSVVNLNGTFYAAYRDNADHIIKLMEIEAP